MRKKETIREKAKHLAEQEQRVKLQLDSHSDDIKDKAKKIGKITLIAGLVGILGYWMFNSVFQDEKTPKKRKKKKKVSKRWGSRMSVLAMPYLNKIFEGIFDKEEEGDEKK